MFRSSRIVLSGLLAIIVALPLASCSNLAKVSDSPDSIRVTSYNIRYNNPSDGLNAWPERKEAFVAKLQEYDPDVLGVQEALASQMEDLKRGLAGYESVGKGRDDGMEAGEYCGLFYKTSLFDLIDDGQFWLSSTPDVVASVGWDASLTRIATWAVLKNKNNGSELFVLNGHFDHRGVESRTQSAGLIMDKTSELAGGRKVVVMGDFNAMPSSAAYSRFVDESAEVVLKDTFAGCKTKSGSVGTFQGFEKRDDSLRRIDYVFISSDISCTEYRVDADLIDGERYYSDHLPVTVDLIVSE